jgi:hypothetical protein
MEEQVGQAALAMIRPSTDPTTRTQASQFLEEWTRTPEAWPVYAKWLQSMRTTNTEMNGYLDSESMGMQLLCFTLLQAKIRREVPRGSDISSSTSLQQIRQELWEYLHQPASAALFQNHPALINPCCICNAALTIRCGMLDQLMQTACGSPPNTNDNTTTTATTTASILLRLLACIPSEVESCQDLDTPQVTQLLSSYLEPVVDTLRRALGNHQGPSPANANANANANATTTYTALQALQQWATTCRVSLSHLNTATHSGAAILPPLIQLLSTTIDSDSPQQHSHSQNQQPLQQQASIFQAASRALTEAILVPSDHGTPAREAAAALIWNAIPHGFVAAPLHAATRFEWDDTAHALATLICTFCSEQVDDVVQQPAEALLQLLLQIQAHPKIPVTLCALECWLTVQDVPSQQRHDHWKAPLFQQVTMGLLDRIAYPKEFTNWEEELEVDRSEFDELRRMVSDVFVSAYFLLRVQFVQLLSHQIIRNSAGHHWTTTEAALFGLNQVYREVSSRCKTKGGGTAIGQDKQATCQELLQLVHPLLQVPAATAHQEHPYMLASMVNFCGSYSPAWQSMECPPNFLLQLLAYLQSAFALEPMASAKATRAIYVGCLSKTVISLEHGSLQQTIPDNGANVNNATHNSNNTTSLVLRSLRNSMEAALHTTEEEAMTTVAEGATRFITHLKDPTTARQSLANDLIHPLLQRARHAMQAIPVDDPQALFDPQGQLAVESLVRYLSVAQVVVRFGDAPHIPGIGELFLSEMAPFLEQTAQHAARIPQIQPLIIPKLIAIHQQLLRTVPHSVIAPTFTTTIQFVVDAFGHTQHPSTLGYIAAAVEVFGGNADTQQSFQDLLHHVTTILTKHVTTVTAQDSSQLLQAYFECLQRYILYCPAGLLANPQLLATIISLAVECLTALHGEKDSTRADLLFLSQLFGWRVLRLSNPANLVFQNHFSAVRDQLAIHGPTICQRCVAGLAGGPQMLWPAYADCLFAIVQSVVVNHNHHVDFQNNPAGGDESSNSSSSLASQWMYASMSSLGSSSMTTETCHQVIAILLNLARQGPKSKQKAKMLLTDFAKISKGEMAPNALVSYAL